MKNMRRLVKLGLLVVLGAFLGGCVVVPLHGWRHGHEYERERAPEGYGYRR